MDNKKIAEELLKADGINPAEPTDAERTAFKKMLDQQLNPDQAKQNLQFNTPQRIVHSRITKFTAAAIILIAALVGINKIGVPIDMAGVALADVAEKMEQIKNAVFEHIVTISSNGKTIKTVHSLVYYAEEGIRKDTVENQKTSQQVYLNLAESKVVGIDHRYKVYNEFHLTKDDHEKMAPISPKHIIEKILSQGNFKKLGKKTIDGIPCVGFEFKDKRTLLSMDQDKVADVLTRIWVNIETKLPTRLELAGTIKDSKINMIMNKPTWDVDLEDNFFEINIPADYLNSEERGLVGINLSNWPTLKVVPGMAAEKAGVKDGDIAVQVNGVDISHVTSQTDALDLFFGKAGETVTLTVKRDEQIVTVEIIRDPLPK